MVTNNSINKRTETLTVTGGDVTIQAGNLTLPNTNSGGTNGVIKLGTTPFMSNFGTLTAFLGGAGNFTNTGNSNLGIGLSALAALTSGTFNVCMGAAAGAGNTTGDFNFALGAFSVNVNTTGQQNVGIGVNALRNLNPGDYNLAIGTSALANLLTGGANIAIGVGAGANYSGAESNNIIFRNNGTVGDSGVIRIGIDGTQTTCFISGIASVSVSNINIVTINTSTSQLGSTNSVVVANGGTGVTSFANTSALLASGTTTTGALQNIASVATGQVLVSAGTSTLPAWSASPSVTSITLGGGTALGNYVEGTFTPGVAFGGGTTGITYGTQTGTYTRIGNTVFFSAVIVLTNKGSSTGNATFTGLPIAAVNANQRAVIAQTQNFTYSATYTNLTWVSAASTNFTFLQFSNAANTVAATDANFANNTGLRFEGFYFV
jgi:hypothetical protein